MNERSIINNLLATVDINVNGSRPWDIKIYNDKLYHRLLSNIDLAFGESYVENWWDCAKLDQLFFKIFTANLQNKILSYPLFWKSIFRKGFLATLHCLFNYQTKERSKTVSKFHYNIGNDLYKLMLDKRMTYTCAYWKDANTLDEAQERKLDLICQKLYLKPGMRVLDIGCGWGSFAKYAAQYYDVEVVGITLSKEQYELGKKLCVDLPIELRLQDYRDLSKTNNQFDCVVSIGMFEHVGYKNYREYMKTIAGCLKEEGLFLLHTIGSNYSNTMTSEWIDTYIFPNGQLPSIQQIGLAIEGIFVMEDWHNFGVYYDKTLMSWYENFNTYWDQLRQQYDERFRRLWNYYLLSCAGSFRARQNQLWQIVLSKQGLKRGYQRLS